MKTNLQELLENIPNQFEREFDPFNEIKLGLLLDSIIAKSDKQAVIKKLQRVMNDDIYESVEDLVNYLIMTITFESDKRLNLFEPVSFTDHDVQFDSIDTFGQYYQAVHYFKNCLRSIDNFEEYTLNKQLLTIKKQNKFIALISVIPKFPGHMEITFPLGYKNEEVKGANAYQAAVIKYFQQLGFEAKPSRKEARQQNRVNRRQLMGRN